jgi:hypothetical protein
VVRGQRDHDDCAQDHQDPDREQEGGQEVGQQEREPDAPRERKTAPSLEPARLRTDDIR